MIQSTDLLLGEVAALQCRMVISTSLFLASLAGYLVMVITSTISDTCLSTFNCMLIMWFTMLILLFGIRSFVLFWMWAYLNDTIKGILQQSLDDDASLERANIIIMGLLAMQMDKLADEKNIGIGELLMQYRLRFFERKVSAIEV